MIKRYLLNIILVLSGFSLFADSSVWKVYNDASFLYIGGTCHVLRKSDYPLPKEFDIAYNDATTLVFETNLGRMKNPEVQQMMMARTMLEDGVELKSILSSTVYQQLNDFCSETGMPLVVLEKFKPQMVVMTLVVLELQKLGVSLEGVDLHFYRRGIADKKEIIGLESIEEQIEFLVSMGLGNENDFVSHSIRDMKGVKEFINDMLIAWKKGDLVALQTLFIDSMKIDYPKLYQSMIVDRNNNWLPQIESLLKTDPKEFVLVGVGHMIGENGILKKLEKRGYKIERVHKK